MTLTRKLNNGMVYTIHNKSDLCLTIIHSIDNGNNTVNVSHYIVNTLRTKYSLVNKPCTTYKLYENSKGFYFNYLGYKFYFRDFKHDVNEISELTKNL